jgi:para-nitrobenzyl esterase
LREARNGLAAAEAAGVEFAKRAGAQSLSELRALSIETLLTVPFDTRENIDGWVLPGEVSTMYAQRKQSMLPVLIGSTATEYSANVARSPKSVEEYRDSLARNYGELAADFERAYPASTATEVLQAIGSFGGHRAYTRHMRNWARLTTSSGTKAFLYYFTHMPPHPASPARGLGAFHGGEIPYVFNNLQQHGWPYTNTDSQLAAQMSSYWTNFVKRGDPNGQGLPRWDAHNLVDEPYMEFGDTSVPKRHFLKQQFDIIERVESRAKAK